jgi:nicotinamide phosphoribosyltransferase
VNLILDTDSYKASHFLQYPPGTEVVSSYIESRGGEFPVVLFFGLQAFLKQYLQRRVSAADIDEAEALFAAHGEPFNRAGWEHILRVHGGRLPLEIEAVPEGALVPVGNALVQVRNTDRACFWLTSYVETALLRAIWYPSTVATLSWHCKQVIRRYLEETGDPATLAQSLPFKLHDFGARGASSAESAALGGLAHLVNFQGSDTVAALLAARRWYGADMAASSIPAAEHSTITVWGRAHELDAYRNMLDRFAGPGKIVACVSDSYDLWAALELWGTRLRRQVLASGATLVVRPDSGEPAEIVPAVIERLMQHFGFATNARGYRTLPPAVRVIQGDGVNLHSIGAMLEACRLHKLSADNLAFGMGGALLQQVHRDTLKWAMKASAAQVHGEWRDVYKAPATDPGKTSKRGRLALAADVESIVKTLRVEQLSGRRNLLRPVFRDGELLIDESLDRIRARAGHGLAWAAG